MPLGIIFYTKTTPNRSVAVLSDTYFHTWLVIEGNGTNGRKMMSPPPIFPLSACQRRAERGCVFLSIQPRNYPYRIALNPAKDLI
jgi:hypothetical protein